MWELPRAAIVSNRCWSVMMNKMSGRLIWYSERSSTWRDCLYVRQLPTRQASKRLDILRRTFFDHFVRQTRGRGGFVPIEGFQIIANKLFVEARRALSDHVLVLWPKTRGIRCQTFVNQKQILVYSAELKFCVCDDNSTLIGMCTPARINVQTKFFHTLG